MKLPDTRNSLIARLGDGTDTDAWYEFSQVYRPIIVRMGLAKGLQQADSEDLAQTILISISGAIERWNPEGPAKFRTWLKRVADNAILSALHAKSLIAQQEVPASTICSAIHPHQMA